jgi:hypothetical protein
LAYLDLLFVVLKRASMSSQEDRGLLDDPNLKLAVSTAGSDSQLESLALHTERGPTAGTVADLQAASLSSPAVESVSQTLSPSAEGKSQPVSPASPELALADAASKQSPKHRITYGEALWQRLDLVKDKTSHGVKICRAMASFTYDRAELDEAYGRALLKAVRHGDSLSSSAWAPKLLGSEGWGGLLAALSHIGNQHVGLGICCRSSIYKSLDSFAALQSSDAARLCDAAHSVAHEMESLQKRYYKAKGAYETACMEASKVIDARDKARSAAKAEAAAAAAAAHAPAAPVRAPQRGASVLLTKMLEKAGENVSKMGMAMAEKRANEVLHTT